jgi:uncharacterized protein YacL
MLKRIFAWILLIMFILLTMNLFIFKIYAAESAILYGILVAMFFFSRAMRSQDAWKPLMDREEQMNGEEEDNDDQGQEESGTITETDSGE